MEFISGAMCRLCLCKNDCFFNIFVVNRIYGYVPAAVISELLHVQVSETDGYPHVICIPCLSKLTNYKSFKEQCHSAKATFDKRFTRNGNLTVFLPETESCSNRELSEEDPLGVGSVEVGGRAVKEEELTVTCNQVMIPEVKQEATDIADENSDNIQDPDHCVNEKSPNEIENDTQYPVRDDGPESHSASIVTHYNQDVLPEIKQESVEIEEDEDAFNQTPDPMRGVIPESSTIAERVAQHFRSRPVDSGAEAHIVEIDPLDQQNLPYSFSHVIKSIRGKEKLVDGMKYIYMEQKKNIRGTKTYWKCEIKECRARVHTWRNGECYSIIKRIGEHHHAPSPVKPKIRRTLDEVKALALSTNLSIQELIDSAVQNLEDDEIFQLPSISCLSRNIRNWRQAAVYERPQQEWIGNS